MCVSLGLIVCIGQTGCTQPYLKQKRLAGLGILTSVPGAVVWAAGDRYNNSRVATVGAMGLALGLTASAVAASWLAASAECDADPDCPDNETCKEIPAAAGNIPYKLCMKP